MRRCHPASILCLLLLIAPPASGNVRQTVSDAATAATFELAVQHYMTLRGVAIRSLPALESSRDVGKIRAAIDARAEAIRSARPLAAGGEIFTPAVGDLFRRRILAALADYGISEDEVVRDGDESESDESLPLVVVNEPFPWERAGRMLSCVLLALPTLPQGLEYRFVGTSLVLVDVDAHLVIDVLPDVLRRSLRA